MATATPERTQAPERERILSDHIATAGHLLTNELDPNAQIRIDQLETASLSQEVLDKVAQRSVDERRKHSQDTNLTYDAWRRGLINWVRDLPTNQEEQRRKAAALQNMGISVSGFNETEADRFYNTYFGREGLESNVDLFINDVAAHYANNLEGLENALIYLGPLAAIFGTNSAEAVKELVYTRCIERNAENRQILLQEYRGKPAQPPVPEHGQRVLNFIRIGRFETSQQLNQPLVNNVAQPDNRPTNQLIQANPPAPRQNTQTPAAIEQLDASARNVLQAQLNNVQARLGRNPDANLRRSLELQQYVIQQRLDNQPVRSLTDEEIEILRKRVEEIKAEKQNLTGNADLDIVKADLEIEQGVLQKTIDQNPQQLENQQAPEAVKVSPDLPIDPNHKLQYAIVKILSDHIATPNASTLPQYPDWEQLLQNPALLTQTEREKALKLILRRLKAKNITVDENNLAEVGKTYNLLVSEDGKPKYNAESYRQYLDANSYVYADMVPVTLSEELTNASGKKVRPIEIRQANIEPVSIFLGLDKPQDAAGVAENGVINLAVADGVSQTIFGNVAARESVKKALQLLRAEKPSSTVFQEVFNHLQEINFRIMTDAFIAEVLQRDKKSGAIPTLTKYRDKGYFAATTLGLAQYNHQAGTVSIALRGDTFAYIYHADGSPPDIYGDKKNFDQLKYKTDPDEQYVNVAEVIRQDIQLKEGDIFLLSSDGLPDWHDDIMSEIPSFIQQHKGSDRMDKLVSDFIAKRLKEKIQNSTNTDLSDDLSAVIIEHKTQQP